MLDTVSGLLPEDRVDERAALVARIAFARRMNGRPFESRALVERTLASLAPDSRGALGLTLELAIEHYWRGEFDSMHEVARAVADRARGAGEPLYWAWGAALCSLASTSSNRPGVGLVELREAEVAYDALPDAQLAEHIDVGGYIAQAAAALERRRDAALEHVRRVLRLAQQTGQSPLIPGLFVLEANALVMKGRIAEAMSVTETATDAAVLTGNDQVVVWALWADAMVCSLAGETARALASAREAVTRSERVTETFFSSLSRLHLASALNAAGDPAGARAELAAVQTGPGQRLLDLRGGLGWDLLTRTLVSLGELDAAAEAAATADAHARLTLLPQRTANAMCARAAVLLARGDPAAAIDTAREALPLAASSGNPVLGARAQALIGTALARAGSGDAAIAELEEAERIAVRGRRASRRRRSRPELRRLGPSHPPADPGCPERRRGGRGAQRPRARGRDARRFGYAQPGRRGGAVREREDRREPPRADLRQARSAVARGARHDRRRRAGGRRAQRRPRSANRLQVAVASVSATGDVLAAAVKARGDRLLARVERAGGLTVGETDEIDRDHRVAVDRGRARDRVLHQLARADALLGERGGRTRRRRIAAARRVSVPQSGSGWSRCCATPAAGSRFRCPFAASGGA